MDKEQMIKVMSYLIGYRVGSQVMPQMLPGLQGDDVLAEISYFFDKSDTCAVDKIFHIFKVGVPCAV